MGKKIFILLMAIAGIQAVEASMIQRRARLQEFQKRNKKKTSTRKKGSATLERKALSATTPQKRGKWPYVVGATITVTVGALFIIGKNSNRRVRIPPVNNNGGGGIPLGNNNGGVKIPPVINNGWRSIPPVNNDVKINIPKRKYKRKKIEIKSDNEMFNSEFCTILDNSEERKEHYYEQVRLAVDLTPIEKNMTADQKKKLIMDNYRVLKNNLLKYHYSLALIEKYPNDQDVIASLYQKTTLVGDQLKVDDNIEEIKAIRRKTKDLPCYFHYTWEEGLQGIITSGWLKHMHNKWLPGAFYSTKPEPKYGDYCFLFSCTVEWDSFPQSQRWTDDEMSGKKQDCVWVGLSRDIDIDNHLYGIALKNDTNENKDKAQEKVRKYLTARKNRLEDELKAMTNVDNDEKEAKEEKIKFLEGEIKAPKRYRVYLMSEIKQKWKDANCKWDNINSRVVPKCWIKIKDAVIYNKAQMERGTLVTNKLTQALR